MATEKEKVDVDAGEKQEKDAKPDEEVVEEGLKEEADEEKMDEKGEEPDEEGVNEKAEEIEMEKEEVKEDQGDEGEMDEEEAEVEEKGDDEGMKTEEEESDKKSEGVKKRSRKVRKGELDSPRTPGSERPTRERKTVERFMVGDTPRALASKTLTIEKGQGTQLKDIPNVAFKLSKRKADENLQLLHTILFGKKSKVHMLKKNIGLFSGFVWVENEEKQRTKVKDKIDKCFKEKLLDFCDILNIPASKTSTKKEELSTRLFDFLESPHATTDRLLADKEKAKKRKSRAATSKSPSSSNAASGKSKKRQKLDAESGKKSKASTEDEEEKEEDEEEKEENKNESSQSEDDHDDDKTVREAESDKEELHSEKGTDSDDEKPEKQIVVEKSSSKRSEKEGTVKTEMKSKSVGKGSHVKDLKAGKSTKKPSTLTSKKEPEAESKLKVKKKKDEKSGEDSKVPTKGASPSKKRLSKSSEKEQGKGKGKGTKAAEKQPGREEMHSVVADMLKEVDFNTATLSDILRQLGKHFGVDLMHRKAEVKEIITEVIESMPDDEGEEGAASGEESGKDGDDE